MSDWHVADLDLAAWVDGTARLATAVSTEQHVERCRRCQDLVASLVDARPGILDAEASWTAVADAVEPQPLPWLGRQLLRLGVSEPTARVTTAAGALAGAWVLSVVVVLALVTLAAAWAGRPGTALFLMLAPILPVLGVALSYGPEVDPLYELCLASPYSKLRLLLVRTGLVLLVCVPLAALAGLGMPGPWWVDLAWLVPSMAFVSLTLAAATVVPPHVPAAVITILWAAAVAWTTYVGEPADLFTATLLTTYLALTGLGVGLLVARVSHLATERRIR